MSVSWARLARCMGVIPPVLAWRLNAHIVARAHQQCLSEYFEVLERCQGAFASESVQRPEEDEVKFLRRGIAQHFLKLPAIRFAARVMVGVSLYDRKAFTKAKIPQLIDLV